MMNPSNTRVKIIISSFLLALFAMPVCHAKSTRVHGYQKKNGHYVQSHRRTSPDKTKSNNWSTKGNVNPYTGKEGTRK